MYPNGNHIIFLFILLERLIRRVETVLLGIYNNTFFFHPQVQHRFIRYILTCTLKRVYRYTYYCINSNINTWINISWVFINAYIHITAYHLLIGLGLLTKVRLFFWGCCLRPSCERRGIFWCRSIVPPEESSGRGRTTGAMRANQWAASIGSPWMKQREQ